MTPPAGRSRRPVRPGRVGSRRPPPAAVASLPGPAGMDVVVLDRQRRIRTPRRTLARRARILLAALGSPRAALAVVLVSDRGIAALNRRFLDRRGPTNVIAFPAGAAGAPGAEEVLGDVVISVETARREAAAAGMPLAERLTELLIHGLLHLHGYDHEQGGREARRMAARARRLRALLAAAEDAPGRPAGKR